MVEKDLMDYVGDCLEQPVKEQKRPTSAGKVVYRVSLSSRPKVEAFLKAILPYVVGELKRSKIQELLDVCDEHNAWIQNGGRSSAGSLAARQKKKSK